MPITQSLSSKGNVKKSTSQDLPFSPSQPVINSYYATSTASQTSIANLGFSVNTTNPDSFWLFVDGKKLLLGAGNDYTFASVGADGSSSAISFNFVLSAGLNIQAFKMGLKPEIQFGMDARFLQIYTALGASLQGFVSQIDFAITPTTTTGTPVAGTFYSSITNRANIVDLSQDLKPRMGVERIITQQIYKLQNEFGPNGEAIYGIVNDTYGQMRLIGSGWGQADSSDGPNISQNGGSTDYAEITFYGTGLNLITARPGSRNIGWKVDGGSETLVSNVDGTSAVLNGLGTPSNTVCPIVSNLTLGVHTVTIRINGTNIGLAGFEILNESSAVKTTPGISYIKGQSLINASLSAISYNAAVTGTAGGRVLVYQKADGTIAQGFTPVSVAPAYLASASHATEEFVREYNFREFGVFGSTDFSVLHTTSSLAFTLDDGVTTLKGISASIQTGENGVALGTTSTSALEFTFVGTGVDIYMDMATGSLGTAESMTVTVDGVSQGTLAAQTTANTRSIRKIASGLPYGTHIVRITRGSTSVVNTPRITSFIVYQPAKPALPAGAVELGDYNVLANYSGNSTAGVQNISTGIIRKVNTRECAYTGTITNSGVDVTNFVSGNSMSTGTNGDYVELTFFGTGINWRTLGPGAAATFTVSLQSLSTGGSLLTFNSTNFAQASTATAYGTLSFTASTGIISASGTQTPGAGFNITGLTLGLYKIRIAKTSGTLMYFDAFDIIAPIHSAKSNQYASEQNTLTVGSQGISDNRKLTPIKDSLPAQKASVEATGVLSSPTTTLTTAPGAPMADMNVTIKTNGGPIEISWSAVVQQSALGNFIAIQPYVDGVAAVGGAGWRAIDTYVANNRMIIGDTLIFPVAAGVHTITLQWYTQAGTATAYSTARTLLVREI